MLRNSGAVCRLLVVTFVAGAAAGCPSGGGGGGGGNRNDNTAVNDNTAGPSVTGSKQDLWTTDTESSSTQDFSGSPLPAGFFDFDERSCEAFAGAADFVGAAISESTTGAADTIVTRDGDPIAPGAPIGATGTVAVRITSLNLRAREPIAVLCDGEATEWTISATLSDTPSPAGELSATKTHDNGGTCQTRLPVLLKLTFTLVTDPGVTRELDFADAGLEPVEFLAAMTWVHRVNPDNPDEPAGFLVGVAGGPEAAKLIADGKAGRRLQGGQTLIACTEHNNPGGSHLHNTCTADTDIDDVPDAADVCRFVFNPDQADRDGDHFGDLCDPCPDDPECPNECEDRCPEVNDELLAEWDELSVAICQMYANCMCLPPSCDPETYELPPACEDLFAELQASSGEFSCLYTRFTGWGCDRCGLPSLLPLACPDPCETITCPSGQRCQQYLGCVEEFDYCEFADCPDGQGCDPENGLCCENPEEGCEPERFDPCDFVNCPQGVCNPATGQCWDPATGECIEPKFDFDPCEFAECDPGQTCDPGTGICLNPDEHPCPEGCAADEFCDFEIGQCVSFCDLIDCPEGTTCNPQTFECE